MTGLTDRPRRRYVPPPTRAAFAIAGALTFWQLHRDVTAIASTAADPGRTHRLLEQECTVLRRENSRLEGEIRQTYRKLGCFPDCTTDCGRCKGKARTP